MSKFSHNANDEDAADDAYDNTSTFSSKTAQLKTTVFFQETKILCFTYVFQHLHLGSYECTFISANHIIYNIDVWNKLVKNAVILMKRIFL